VKKLKAFLIFRASDQNLRVVRTRPAVAWDEMYWEIEISVPDPWGRLAGSIVIDLPEGGPAKVEVVNREAPA
jgi:hypothetical protein